MSSRLLSATHRITKSVVSRNSSKVCRVQQRGLQTSRPFYTKPETEEDPLVTSDQIRKMVQEMKEKDPNAFKDVDIENMVKDFENLPDYSDVQKFEMAEKAKAAEKGEDEIPDAKVVTESLTQQEVVTGAEEQLDFQAETQKLLHIVAHSLYSDRSVFVREVISNASDALEKFRYLQTTNQTDADPKELQIKLFVDEAARTFAIQDNGVGMTKDELISNLGTIAHSGSKKFLSKLQDGASAKEGIIGQFGVGFYSTFMVGDKITVFTKSCTPGSVGYCWKSDGLGKFTLSEAENVEVGTKIIVHLKEDALEFSKAPRVSDLIKNMSNFVSYPVLLDGDIVNNIQPLWTMNKNEITQEQHEEFYKFITNAWDGPAFQMMFKTDGPYDIKSIFYFPNSHPENMGNAHMEPGVMLYSRKVLIQKNPEKLLPNWLRFVKGVVDCDDIPLNLSRELLQDNRLVRRLNEIFTGKIIKHLEFRMDDDATLYDEWFLKFGNFFREGICTDAQNASKIARLLRIETSNKPVGEFTTFQDYVRTMPEDQKEIYYAVGESRSLLEHSPYMEAFKDKEVLFFYSNMDEIMTSSLREFEGKKLRNIESSSVDSDAPDASAHKEDIKWLKEAMGENCQEVKMSSRLSSHPALIVDHDSQMLRAYMKQINGSQGFVAKNVIEINFEHNLIKQMLKLKETNPTLAAGVAKQVFTNARISAGILEDIRALAPEINQLMSDFLTIATNQSKNEGLKTEPVEESTAKEV